MKNLNFLLLAVTFFASSAALAGVPGYCVHPTHANTLACMESKPGYCVHSTYGNTLACMGAKPGYCVHSTYANTAACVASNPGYCVHSTYADTLACMQPLGSNLETIRIACSLKDLGEVCKLIRR